MQFLYDMLCTLVGGRLVGGRCIWPVVGWSVVGWSVGRWSVVDDRLVRGFKKTQKISFLKTTDYDFGKEQFLTNKSRPKQLSGTQLFGI